MKIFEDVIKYFNKRVRLDPSSITKLNQSTKEQAIVNGDAASRLLSGSDLSLQYNLFKFAMMEELEGARTDEERVSVGYKVQGMREFIDHLEKQEYFGKLVKERG